MNFDNLKNESNKLVQFANESTQRVGEIYNENKPTSTTQEADFGMYYDIF
jgi:hypothetical protein